MDFPQEFSKQTTSPLRTVSITLTRPDDWHVHLRDGSMLERVAPFTARQFGRALVMPNLDPPVRTVREALAYRDRILEAVPDGTRFDPKMSIYLTEETALDQIRDASTCEHVLGFKLYPAGATTNSAFGVNRVSAIMEILESMARQSVCLQVHGEVTDPHIDVFDREAVFIDQVLAPVHRELPELKIVLEHITTRQGIEFVRESGANVAGTITPQHLMYNRNEMFRGGIRPHQYCLPVLKREEHRLALLEAATGGDPSFFLGTDSAPHTKNAKENACGCAGVFSAAAAIECYAEVFDSMDRIDRLEGFASHHGADFYRLLRNTEQITLERRPFPIPESIGTDERNDGTGVVPLKAGEAVSWSIQGHV
ncbi:MAG: dihydroorotase [Gammaproteobacteria bacterium]|nr:dihydroorotase [Gammaproteobacteria bacterium]MYD76725.1 dihydroorotase [Gammaproteobacteria bacterium]MYJ51669.1 dihydroorotase [Gammaproteobacteria bacterium]